MKVWFFVFSFWSSVTSLFISISVIILENNFHVTCIMCEKGGDYEGKGVRLYGVKDIRMKNLNFRDQRDEILLKILCNGIAMSTLKEITLAQRHLRFRRTYEDIRSWSDMNSPVSLNRWVKVEGSVLSRRQVCSCSWDTRTDWVSGYSYEYFGGAATYCIVPGEVIEKGCLLTFEGRAFMRQQWHRHCSIVKLSLNSTANPVPRPHFRHQRRRQYDSWRMRAHGADGYPLCSDYGEETEKACGDGY